MTRNGATTLTLPWPPSGNLYYRRVGPRTLISRDGRAYRANVLACVMEQGAPRFGKARIALSATAYPPDKRARDLDNLWKAVSDALEHAGVFDDDAQVDDLRITRGEPTKGGQLVIQIGGA